MFIYRYTIKPLAAALLAATLVNGAALADAGKGPTESRIKEDVTVLPGRQITPQEEAAISSAAVKVLRHIASARGELQGDKPDTVKAKGELEQAEKLLDIIQAGLPTTKVKDHIWVAKKHLEYEDSREVLPDLVPIYASLEELVDSLPTDQAKAHLDQAKHALKQGDKPKAAAHLQEVDDALLYVEADLPVSFTRQALNRAMQDLEKGDNKAADQVLNAAENSVVFISVSYQSPLMQAKTALWRASQAYLQDEIGKAKTALDEAVKHLQRAAQSDDQITPQAAEKMVAEVRDLHRLIESGDKGLSDRLASAWHRTKALSERSAEYLSTGWQRLRAEGAGKKDLIEAKLQLAYARIDHLSAKDDAAAKADLVEAKGYLETASNQVSATVKPKVEEVATLVKQLEKALADNDPYEANGAAFDKAETRLVKLIRHI